MSVSNQDGKPQDALVLVGESCLCCGAREREDRIEARGFSYRVCGRCGTASLDHLPSLNEAARIYDRGYFNSSDPDGYLNYDSDEALHRRNARQRLKSFKPAAAGSALLDIGCATGFLLSEAARRGFSVTGADVSEWARRRVEDRFAFRVVDDPRRLLPENRGRFDAIAACQVLEHAPRPDLLIASCRELLRPNGRLLIETWDRSSRPARRLGMRWQQISPPSVVHLFSMEGLEQLLVRHGLELISIRRPVKFVSLGLVGHLLGTRLPRQLRWAAAMLTRDPLARAFLPYRSSDLVQIVTSPMA